MSLSLKEILTEMAHTVGRAHLIEHISVLPIGGADDQGETESEKLAKRNPLNAEEEKLLAKLQARQDAINSADKEDTPADDKSSTTASSSSTSAPKGGK